MTVGSIEASFLFLTDSLQTLTPTLFDLSYSNDPARKARDREAGVCGQEEKREGPNLARALVTAVCSIRCNKTSSSHVLKPGQTSSHSSSVIVIFLQWILHVFVTRALARFGRVLLDW